MINEPPRGKINNVVSKKGPTQTDLYKHRKELKAGHFGFK